MKSRFEADLKEFLFKQNIEFNSDKIKSSYSDFSDYHYQSSLLLTMKSINRDQLVDFLKSKKYYQSIDITGPGFISVKFDLFDPVVTMAKTENKLKVVVDYCGVNVAKKMHIGHIRSMFLGDYIVRLHQNKGDDVVKMNHVGDWGIEQY